MPCFFICKINWGNCRNIKKDHKSLDNSTKYTINEKNIRKLKKVTKNMDMLHYTIILRIFYILCKLKKFAYKSYENYYLSLQSVPK